MGKRALLAVLGFFSLCLPLAAQQANPSPQIEDEKITLEQMRNTSALDAASAMTLYQPDIFNTVDSSVLIHGLPVPAIVDERRFPVSNELARIGMRPLDLFPIALVSAVQKQKANASPIDSKDLASEENLRSSNQDFYSSGEMGFLYGTTTGKSGYETKQGYLMGTVGNDKFQITAGASYQEFSGRIPRFGSFTPTR